MFPIVEKLGGWNEAERVLSARGVSFTGAGRAKWISRKQLPRDVVAALGAEASARRIVFDVDDFAIPDDRAA